MNDIHFTSTIKLVLEIHLGQKKMAF